MNRKTQRTKRLDHPRSCLFDLEAVFPAIRMLLTITVNRRGFEHEPIWSLRFDNPPVGPPPERADSVPSPKLLTDERTFPTKPLEAPRLRRQLRHPAEIAHAIEQRFRRRPNDSRHGDAHRHPDCPIGFVAASRSACMKEWG